MKFLFASIILLVGLTAVTAQTEQSPIVASAITYNDWLYPDVKTGTDMNLRKFVRGKKLVMVAYFAPWCPNWKHDVRFVQKMYIKYKDSGFDVVGVGEYDPVEKMAGHIDSYKITFPVVWESNLRTAKQTTQHYAYRTAAGDQRGWGSPWYVFLEGRKFEKEGRAIEKKPYVVNGELIQIEAEKFIREKLGLKEEKAAVINAKQE